MTVESQRERESTREREREREREHERERERGNRFWNEINPNGFIQLFYIVQKFLNKLLDTQHYFIV